MTKREAASGAGGIEGVRIDSSSAGCAVVNLVQESSYDERGRKERNGTNHVGQTNANAKGEVMRLECGMGPEGKLLGPKAMGG